MWPIESKYMFSRRAKILGMFVRGDQRKEELYALPQVIYNTYCRVLPKKKDAVLCRQKTAEYDIFFNN